MKEAIDLSGETGRRVLHRSGARAHQRRPGNSREEAEEKLAELCRYADKRGVTIAFEPQAPEYSNYIATLTEAFALFEKVGTKNMTLTMDIFHLYINESSMFKSICRAAGQIGFVHVSDAKRFMMGTHSFPVADYVSAIDATGYDGWYSPEVLQLPDEKTAAQMSFLFFDYLRRVIFTQTKFVR
jgi:D-psicose/D-tagatose/L-ribulose 3-epimerase